MPDVIRIVPYAVGVFASGRVIAAVRSPRAEFGLGSVVAVIAGLLLVLGPLGVVGLVIDLDGSVSVHVGAVAVGCAGVMRWPFGARSWRHDPCADATTHRGASAASFASFARLGVRTAVLDRKILALALAVGVLADNIGGLLQKELVLVACFLLLVLVGLLVVVHPRGTPVARWEGGSWNFRSLVLAGSSLWIIVDAVSLWL